MRGAGVEAPGRTVFKEARRTGRAILGRGGWLVGLVFRQMVVEASAGCVRWQILGIPLESFLIVTIIQA